MRQIADRDGGDLPARDARRYLAIMTVEDGKPGRPVQLQQPESSPAAAQ